VKYTFHIVDVFSSTPFGGNQLAVLPDAAGISTEGMQKIAREFNFGETAFILPKNDAANTCRVRIFTPRAELDFVGHPTVGTACALVMKQHVRLSDPIRLILEENVGPVTVDVTQQNGGFHGRLTLSGKIEAPTGAPSPTDLAAVLSIEPAEVSQVFFAGVGVPICFAHLNSNKVVDRAAINQAAWSATLSRAWSPHLFFFAGNLRDGGKLYARMWAPALGVEEDNATGSAGAALVGAMASKPDFGGMAYRLSIQQGVLMGRRSEIEAEARRRGDLCQRWRRHGLHRKRRNRGAAVRACVLERRVRPNAREPLGDYLRGRSFRRFAGTLLRLLVTGFLVSAASNR
jgi:trans-2,3-dihydro-3-hydroxyanthranilate isomerase